MNNRTRSVVAAALTAAVALGVSAPAASAASHKAAGKGHAKVKVERTQKSGQVKKADRLLVNAKRQAAMDVKRRDARLAKVLDRDELALLAPEVADVVRASVAADRVRLAELGALASGATTLIDVKDAAVAIKAVRPEIYSTVLADLLLADEIETQVSTVGDQVAALRTSLAERTAAGEDVTGLEGSLDEATAFLDEAVVRAGAGRAGALTLDAGSTRDEIKAVKSELAAGVEALEAAAELVAQVEAALVVVDVPAEVPTEEPTVAPEPVV